MCSVLVGEAKGMNLFGNHGYELEYNIEMVIKDI